MTQGETGTNPTANVFSNNRMSNVPYDNAGSQQVVNGDTMKYDTGHSGPSTVRDFVEKLTH